MIWLVSPEITLFWLQFLKLYLFLKSDNFHTHLKLRVLLFMLCTILYTLMNAIANTNNFLFQGNFPLLLQSAKILVLFMLSLPKQDCLQHSLIHGAQVS